MRGIIKSNIKIKLKSVSMKILPINNKVSLTGIQYKKHNNTDDSLLDSINILDYEKNKKLNLAAQYNKLYSAIGSIPMFLACGIFATNQSSTITQKKSNLSSKTLIPMSVLSVVTYYLCLSKMSKEQSFMEYAGCYEALANELAAPETFAELTEEQQNEINQNREIKLLEYRKYTSETNSLLNFNIFKKHNDHKIIKNKHDLNRAKISDICNKTENTDDITIPTSEIINKINRYSEQYTKGVIQGMSLFMAFTAAMAIGALALFSRVISKKTPPLSLAIASSIAISSPFLIFMYMDPRQEGFEKIARFKAKERVANEIKGIAPNNINGPLGYFKDYILNKKKYNIEIEHQAQMLAQKNQLKQNFDFSAEQMEKAKLIQNKFYKTILKNPIKDKGLRLKENIAQNLVPFATLVPVLYFVLRNSANSNADKYLKNMVKSLGIVTASSIANIGLTQCLLNNNDKTKI